MSRAIVCLVVLLLVPSGLASQQIQGGIVGGPATFATPPPPGPNGQPVRDTRPTTGNSRIRGRVVVADTGQPARRATVRINAPEMRDNRTTTTDVDGRYEFANLPAGRYSINANKNGFLTLSYGQTKPTSPPRTLTLADKQDADNINLLLVRGGAIAGRVLDDFGDPVSGATVMVLRSQFQSGQQRLIQLGFRGTTNDLGEYRVFGLNPGAYYILATPPTPPPQIMVNGAPAASDDRNGFAPVYYPGTADANGATRVNLTAGQTASEINFSLVGTRLAHVSGFALDSQGRPMTAGNVLATLRGKVQGLPSQNGQLKDDGSFVIPNLPPGEYLLRANPRTAPPPPPPAATLTNEARNALVAAANRPPPPAVGVVTVTGDDVSGVRLAPVVPVTIRGRITFSDATALASVKPSSVRIISEILNPDDGPSGPPAAPPVVRDDFSFELAVQPGLVLLRPVVAPAAPGSQTQWVLRSLRVNGIDRIDAGIEIRPDENVGDVELELTGHVSELSGNVVTSQREPAANHLVLVFAQDRRLWTAPVSRSTMIRSDPTGHFVWRNVRPGRYYGVAVAEVDNMSWTDPEFLQALSARATMFTVTEGEKKTLDLQVVDQ